MAEPLLELARRRDYRGRTGNVADVRFVCQGVTETWRHGDGKVIAAGSVDVVNASGVVGHHLNRDTVMPLVREVCRVLSPAGIAMLDAGPSLPAADLRQIMEAAGGCYRGRYRSGWWDPTGELVFQMGAQ